jgi:hypothetical protein
MNNLRKALWVIILLLPLTMNGKVIKTVNVGNGTTLEAAIGTDVNIDSLVITGSMSAADMVTLKGLIFPNGIDMSACTVAGDSLPSYEFNRNVGYKVEYVTLPSTLQTIGNGAFMNSGIRSIEIPSTVKKIGKFAFMNCIRLRGTVKIPEGVTWLSTSCFEGCPLLEGVKLPSTLTGMGPSCLWGDGNIKELTLPEGLLEIGNCACVGLSISTLIVPSTMVMMGDWAFQNCFNLTKVYSKCTKAPGESETNAPRLANSLLPATSSVIKEKSVYAMPIFGDAAAQATLYVPVNAKVFYTNNVPWAGFKEIVETSTFPSAVSATSIDANGWAVTASKGSIAIAGKQGARATRYAIYNADGSQLNEGTVMGNATVAVPAGFYIVSIDGNATKVIVK